jgi:hypothetical protein
MSEIKFEIIKKIGVLSKSASKWTKEIIREWSPDRKKRGKGVNLSREELLALKELLNNIEL